MAAAENRAERAPCTRTPFTISDIKKAIPSHCFQPSLIRSFSFVFTDLFFASVFYFIADKFLPLLPRPYYYLAWPIYWAFQGCVCFGLWVIAHDCGHHAFSEYQWIDDTVGFLLQTSIFIPYFSWKFSHRRHHSYNGCLEQDNTFVPKLKSQIPWYSKYLDHPPGRLLLLIITIFLGLPMYLSFNVSGRQYDRFASHYDPYGPIFKDSERFHVIFSDAGLAAVTYFLYQVSLVKGPALVICLYCVPILIFNGLLVLVAYLQHAHPALPHYDLTEWDWLRGALVTSDRDYGVFNIVFHHIGDKHVIHHLFPRMPHYHTTEATEAVKPLLGKYYRFDDTPIFAALWREVRECLYIEPDEGKTNKGVYWYQNKY